MFMVNMVHGAKDTMDPKVECFHQFSTKMLTKLQVQNLYQTSAVTGAYQGCSAIPPPPPPFADFLLKRVAAQEWQKWAKKG